MNIKVQLLKGSRSSGRGSWEKIGVWARLVGSALIAGAALALAGCGPNAPTSGAPGNPAGAASKQPSNGGAAAAGKATNALAGVPKAVFRANPDSGRDPFFPGSSRRLTLPSEPVMVQLPPINYLKLLGIRPGTDRPMALINKTTLGPGEEGDVAIVLTNQLNKAEVHKVNVRCLEIRHDSVLISIAGEQEPKELHIAQGK